MKWVKSVIFHEPILIIQLSSEFLSLVSAFLSRKGPFDTFLRQKG
ncbi:unknown protein [Simkania negevensis Z]|uniref:Uncharacterized protein n=1 Tax=Simkania negevensis (strain ATCC VR-1471 / DSM 27360 / Z) TaxID=331113 RepID=F8L7U3_SIMNZ|nr:unknown protein [Simkania negevensis Z]